MKPSIMDKIRILRSNRRKTTYTEKKVVKPTPSADAVATPTSLAQPVIAEATQQWVPVLVLDISQSQNPVTKTIPVTLASSTGKNIGIKKSILVKKAVSVVNVGQHLPLPTENTGSMISNSTTENTQIISVNSEKVVGGVDSQVPTDPTNTVDSSETQDDASDISGKPVKCVFCDKSFPTLKDMQVHYLNSHKSRRGKDSRKRKTNPDSVGTKADSSPEADLIEGDQEKGDLDITVSENDKSDPKCPVCYIEFKSGKEVMIHMKEVHAYVCSECSETFYNLMQFTSHKCTKGTKKVKRTRKKSSGSTKTDNSKPRSNAKTSRKQNNKRTKDPPEPILKPEVAKIMNRFVQIQPKTKRVSKKVEVENTSPPPPLQQAMGPRLSIVSENGFHQNQSSEAGAGKEDTVSTVIANDPAVIPVNDVPPVSNLTGSRDDKNTDDTHFQPAIETTYTLKSQQDLTTTVSYSEANEKKENQPVKVIETNNIDQAKKLVQSVELGKEDKFLSKNQIREKIAELRRNPNVSVSWRPTLRTRNFQDDEEFVCGRCNVLCDDMEDYMDHLHDCLTMSSVSLEPVVAPARRLLRLHHEIASFGSRDEGGKCGINKNLLSKLKEYLPQTGINHTLLQGQSSQEGRVTSNQQHFSPTSSSPHAFKELLDDDLSCESQELETQILGPCSPHSSVAQEIEGQATDVLTDHDRGGMVQLPTTQRLNTGSSTGARPMVMIPVSPREKMKISVIPEQVLKKPQHHSSSENRQEVTSDREALSASPSPATSPLDLLLDQDEIKMEVEEELVEDHYEES